MSSLRRPRFTIGKIMLWIAGFAALIALPRFLLRGSGRSSSI